MVRYRTRDLTRLLPGTSRTMRRMQKITGRSDDMIILRGVNVFPTQIEEQVMAIGDLAPYFQIELHKSGHMDAMRVLVEANPQSADEASRVAAATILTKQIKDIVGVSTEVTVGEPGAVPRSQGKAVRVVDNRGVA
jgi:phenylacetate-CoA ligase